MTESMNAPDGDFDNSPKEYSVRELRNLLAGAELLRYSEGTGEHDSNVMAVFEVVGGLQIGITMDDSSETPDQLVGETTRRLHPYAESQNSDDVDATIDFEGRDNPSIRIKNTEAVGVYEIREGV